MLKHYRENVVYTVLYFNSPLFHLALMVFPFHRKETVSIVYLTCLNQTVATPPRGIACEAGSFVGESARKVR